jgi:hypothetical protein
MIFGNNGDNAARDEEIWRLHRLGYTVREIEEETGIPKSTADRVIQQARKRRLAAEQADAEPVDELDAVDELAGITAVNLDPSPDAYRAELEAELDEDPTNALALHRLMYLPPPGYGLRR